MAAAPCEEDKRVEELLNREVQSVLLDGDIQKFISLLKTDPENAHRLAASQHLFIINSMVHIPGLFHKQMQNLSRKYICWLAKEF